MSESQPRERPWDRAIQLSFSRFPDPQEQCQTTQLVVWSHYISVVLWVLSPSGTSPVGSGEEVLCWGPFAAPQRNLSPEDLVWCFLQEHESVVPPCPAKPCNSRFSAVSRLHHLHHLGLSWGVKRLLTVRETRVQSLGREDPREKEMATHSSILAWRILWTEEPAGLQSMVLQKVGHDWTTSLSFNGRVLA